MEFEALLESQRPAIERFVRYRMPSQADADDVLQEVYLAAYRNFPQLKDQEAFRPWLIRIAWNKCNDYFRRKGAALEIPLEELAEKELADTRHGLSVVTTVRETVELLGDKDKQLLYLYFWKELPQLEIARRLDIPLGTVKSRLHTVKQHFKDRYPYAPQKPKGEWNMKKMPERMLE